MIKQYSSALKTSKTSKTSNISNIPNISNTPELRAILEKDYHNRRPSDINIQTNNFEDYVKDHIEYINKRNKSAKINKKKKVSFANSPAKYRERIQSEYNPRDFISANLENGPPIREYVTKRGKGKNRARGILRKPNISSNDYNITGIKSLNQTELNQSIESLKSYLKEILSETQFNKIISKINNLDLREQLTYLMDKLIDFIRKIIKPALTNSGLVKLYTIDIGPNSLKKLNKFLKLYDDVKLGNFYNGRYNDKGNSRMAYRFMKDLRQENVNVYNFEKQLNNNSFNNIMLDSPTNLNILSPSSIQSTRKKNYLQNLFPTSQPIEAYSGGKNYNKSSVKNKSSNSKPKSSNSKPKSSNSKPKSSNSK